MTLREQLDKILSEKKLSGRTENLPFKDDVGNTWGGFYRGKKFSEEFSIQNFGKEVTDTEELVVDEYYNIYDEEYDQWFCRFRFNAVEIGFYNFVYDRKNETGKFDKRKLKTLIGRGHIILYQKTINYVIN